MNLGVGKMNIIQKMRDKYQPEVYELAMYERIEHAESAVDSLICEQAYKIHQSIHDEPCSEDFKGLLVLEDLIADRKADEETYTEALDEGKDIARNELEPIIKALLYNFQGYTDQKTIHAQDGTQYTIKYIEGRLTT
jgi:hypothetical protein